MDCSIHFMNYRERVQFQILISNSRDKPAFHPLSNLISQCGYLLEKFPSVMVSHVYREENKCADVFDKEALNHAFGSIFFHVAPTVVFFQLQEDIIRVKYHILIISN